MKAEIYFDQNVLKELANLKNQKASKDLVYVYIHISFWQMFQKKKINKGYYIILLRTLRRFIISE